MSFKQWWKNRPYWQKGAMIGAIISSTPFILYLISGLNLGEDYILFWRGTGRTILISMYAIPLGVFTYLVWIPLQFLGLYGYTGSMENPSNFILIVWYIFLISFYILIGTLIGLIIQKVRKK